MMFGSMYRDSKLAAEAEAGDETAMERLEKLSEEKADLRVYELDEGDIITIISHDFEVLADKCSQFKEDGYSYSGTPQAVSVCHRTAHLDHVLLVPVDDEVEMPCPSGLVICNYLHHAAVNVVFSGLV